MIVKPFDFGFWILILITAILILGLYYILRNKSEKTKVTVITTISIINLIIFFSYKFLLQFDQEYLVTSGIQSFSWWAELPLHLCNISIIIIPLSLIFQKRILLSFSFFISPLGAFFALMFPEPAFNGFNIFIPRIFGFYILHILVVVCGISIVTLGFLKPRFKDILWTNISILGLALFVHFINIALRTTVCDFANYFFTFGADISILNLLWNFIPYPFFYELPCLLILNLYMVLLIVFFHISEKHAHTTACKVK